MIRLSRIKSMLAVAGILDIMPKPTRADYSAFMPKGTPEDVLRGDWCAVGKDLESAMKGIWPLETRP